MDGSRSQRFRRSTPVTTLEVQDRLVLFHPGLGKTAVLNPTGSQLWSFLETPRTADAVADHLRGMFPSLAVPQAEHDASEFLKNLVQQGLLSVEEGTQE